LKRIYYGWWLVGIATVTNMFVYGTTYQAFQVFVLPASKEYGLSRAEMNTAMVLFSFGAAALAPFLGRLIDFVSPKLVIRAGVLLLGGSFVVLGATHSVWLSAAIFALPLAAALQCAAQLTLPLLVNRWFVVQRGRAMALAVLGLSLGLVAVVPLIALLISRFGWRPTLMIMAVAVTVLLLALALFVRDRPGPEEREGGAAVAPQATANRPLKVAAILRMPQFWTITLGNTLASAIASALAVSLVPIGIARGLTPVHAAWLVSVGGVAAVFAKLALAVVADKVSRIYLMVGVFALAAAANAAMLAVHSHQMLFLCAAALGITSGSFTPLLYALLADRFGAASFGTVAGLLSPFSLALGAIFVRFAGEVFDRTGAYDLMHLVFTAFGLLAAVIMLATRFTRKVEAAPLPA
jgi:MFS family permease